jgi:hypothetical protein
MTRNQILAALISLFAHVLWVGALQGIARPMRSLEFRERATVWDKQ